MTRALRVKGAHHHLGSSGLLPHMSAELTKRLRDHIAYQAFALWSRWKPFVDVGPAGSAILVAGSGRSGTTWVGNVIAEMTGTRPMFEPFILTTDLQFAYAEASIRTRRLDSNTSLYARPDGQLPPREHLALTRILNGRVRAPWIDRDAKARFYWGRTIKGIRANLLLGYIACHWPQVRVIWLVRDPRDVVDSQLAKRTSGWHFDCNLDVFLKQPQMSDDWLRGLDHSWIYATAGTVVGRLTHRWCIENVIPSVQGITRFSNVMRVDYEILRGSEDSWHDVAKHVSEDSWDMARLRRVVSRRSDTSRSGEERLRTDAVRWPYLSEKDVEAIASIVRVYEKSFNVTLIARGRAE